MLERAQVVWVGPFLEEMQVSLSVGGWNAVMVG